MKIYCVLEELRIPHRLRGSFLFLYRQGFYALRLKF